MSEAGTDAGVQLCPACGAKVDTSKAEPLARVACPQCGEKLRVDRSFDNFLLLETLGTGDMGTVYKARDTQLDRLVALKLLRSEPGSATDPTSQLQHEARVTASINHPHVVKVYSLGSDHGQFYVVMELVDHGSLDDLIAQLRRVPEERVLEIGIQIANGLVAAQEKGLIHRDIKPANILFSDEQTAKIVDFGLAGAAEQKTEAKGEIWATPYYVAPENLNNEPEDFRSDLNRKTPATRKSWPRALRTFAHSRRSCRFAVRWRINSRRKRSKWLPNSPVVKNRRTRFGSVSGAS